MPNWRYREKRDYPINVIPPTERFLMRHAHVSWQMRQLILKGIVVPQNHAEIKVELKLTYTDIKQLHAGETIEKEFKCKDCGEVDTYMFHLRKSNEQQEIAVTNVVVKEDGVRNDN